MIQLSFDITEMTYGCELEPFRLKVDKKVQCESSYNLRICRSLSAARMYGPPGKACEAFWQPIALAPYDLSRSRASGRISRLEPLVLANMICSKKTLLNTSSVLAQVSISCLRYSAPTVHSWSQGRTVTKPSFNDSIMSAPSSVPRNGGIYTTIKSLLRF